MPAPQSITEPIEPSASSLRPVDDSERIVPVDVLRGVALLGILLMNIQLFSMIGAAYANPTAYGDLHGANWWIWLLCHILADQKFMTVFSMLFGASILLMTQHIEARGLPSARLHYRSMGWLIVYPLRRIAVGKQLLVAGLLLAIGSGIFLAGYYSMSWWPADRSWSTACGNQRPNRRAARLLLPRKFYFSLARARTERAREHNAGLFRLGILASDRTHARGDGDVQAGYLQRESITASLYRNDCDVHQEIKSGWSFGYSFFLAAQYNYFASILVSFGWIGSVMLGWKSRWCLAYMGRLAAVGRMAFSNYILHTLICTTIFYGYGLGQFGKVARTTQIAIVMAIWILQLVISPIWLEKFQYGPLEWVWRSSTYGRRQPFLRARHGT